MRIGSLLPSATEIVRALGLGDPLVAVTHECDLPPGARPVPVITHSTVDHGTRGSREIHTHVTAAAHRGSSIYALDQELLERLDPDIVLTQELCDVCAVSYDQVAEAVHRLDAKVPGQRTVLSLEPKGLAGILDVIEQVGDVTGVPERSAALIRELKTRLDRVVAVAAGATTRPRVFAMEWLDPPYSAGHWGPERVRLAGGPDEGGREGGPAVGGSGWEGAGGQWGVPGSGGGGGGRREGRGRRGPATVSGEHRPVPLGGATVRVARMGRWDGREDPRVRRPIRGGRFKTLSRKRSEAVRRYLMSIGLVSLALGAPVAAQETQKLEPVVVTATKIETPATEVGASVSVVTEDDFRAYHYATVDEALRSVPGVDIRRSGTLGKTSSITIRGANSNQVQGLVDGVRVKSTTPGLAELSDLSPDLIERIEVIRGPQSTLYGADAIGGVINIITKKGKGPLSGSVQQEAGNYDTYASRASFGGSVGIFDYAISGSHLESNGHFKNDDSTQNAINARLGLTLPGNTLVSYTLRYNRTDTGLPVKFVSTNFGPLPIDPVIDSNNRQTSETYVRSFAVHTRPVTWWESDLRLGGYQNTIAFVDLPDMADEGPFPPCELSRRFQVERREVEWVNHFHAGRWSTSSFGLEHRRDEGRSLGAPFRAASDTNSGFFQEQLRFFERLFVTTGVRVEDNSEFGRNHTERGSLAWVVKESGTRIRGGAGSGFRAPTFNEEFFPGFSDPTLKPEVSFSLDVGVDH